MSDQLLREIATNGAEYAVGAYGQHLDKARQKRLYRRFFDAIYASLMTLDELTTARRIREQSRVSEN